MADSTIDSHDIIIDGKYKKRCRCLKCVRKYDEFCKKNKEEGETICKRKCHMVCEVECEKSVAKTYNWGYKKEYEGKFERIDGKDVPRPCDKDDKECIEKQSKKSRSGKRH